MVIDFSYDYGLNFRIVKWSTDKKQKNQGIKEHENWTTPLTGFRGNKNFKYVVRAKKRIYTKKRGKQFNNPTPK